MEGEWAEPNGQEADFGIDPDTNNDFDDAQATYEQDPDNEPFDEPVEQENDYLGTEFSPDPDSEIANNMAGLVEEGGGGGEQRVITVEEVKGWDQKQTADHLRQIGVEEEHCEEMEKQEITGDVLLEMNQNTITSEHFNFGVMGRRLKTARAINQFQEDVKAGTLRAPPESIIEEDAEEVGIGEEDPLGSRNFKHPFRWRRGMAKKLQIEETRGLQPTELLPDLEPKWVGQHPTFLDAMKAVHRSQDDIGDILSSHEQAKFLLRLSQNETGGVERATTAMCADWFDMFNGKRKLKKYRKSTADDDNLWLRIGVQQFKLRTAKCIHAFPSEDEYPNSFPIAAVLRRNEDLYEPSGTIGLARLENYWYLREKSSRKLEQSAILLAMAQAQARVLDLSRFNPCLRNDQKLQTLQSFLLVVNGAKVEIVRSFISRQYVDAVNSSLCREIPRDLPKNLSFRIQRSAPIDVREEEGWQSLLSAVEALVRSYDKMEPVFAERRPLLDSLALVEEGDPVDTLQESTAEDAEGEFGPSDEADEPLDTPEEMLDNEGNIGEGASDEEGLMDEEALEGEQQEEEEEEGEGEEEEEGHDELYEGEEEELGEEGEPLEEELYEGEEGGEFEEEEGGEFEEEEGGEFDEEEGGEFDEEEGEFPGEDEEGEFEEEGEFPGEEEEEFLGEEGDFPGEEEEEFLGEEGDFPGEEEGEFFGEEGGEFLDGEEQSFGDDMGPESYEENGQYDDMAEEGGYGSDGYGGGAADDGYAAGGYDDGAIDDGFGAGGSGDMAGEGGYASEGYGGGAMDDDYAPGGSDDMGEGGGYDDMAGEGGYVSDGYGGGAMDDDYVPGGSDDMGEGGGYDDMAGEGGYASDGYGGGAMDDDYVPGGSDDMIEGDGYDDMAGEGGYASDGYGGGAMDDDYAPGGSDNMAGGGYASDGYGGGAAEDDYAAGGYDDGAGERDYASDGYAGAADDSYGAGGEGAYASDGYAGGAGEGEYASDGYGGAGEGSYQSDRYGDAGEGDYASDRYGGAADDGYAAGGEGAYASDGYADGAGEGGYVSDGYGGAGERGYASDGNGGSAGGYDGNGYAGNTGEERAANDGYGGTAGEGYGSDGYAGGAGEGGYADDDYDGAPGHEYADNEYDDMRSQQQHGDTVRGGDYQNEDRPVDDFYGDDVRQGEQSFNEFAGDDYAGGPQSRGVDDDYDQEYHSGGDPPTGANNNYDEDNYDQQAQPMDMDDDYNQSDYSRRGSMVDNDYPGNYDRENPLMDDLQDNSSGSKHNSEYDDELRNNSPSMDDLQDKYALANAQDGFPRDGSRLDQHGDDAHLRHSLVGDENLPDGGYSAHRGVDDLPKETQYGSEIDNLSGDEYQGNAVTNDLNSEDELPDEGPSLSGDDRPFGSPIAKHLSNDDMPFGSPTETVTRGTNNDPNDQPLNKAFTDDMESGLSDHTGDHDVAESHISGWESENDVQASQVKGSERPLDESGSEDDNQSVTENVNDPIIVGGIAKTGYDLETEPREELHSGDEHNGSSNFPADHLSKKSPLTDLSPWRELAQQKDIPPEDIGSPRSPLEYADSESDALSEDEPPADGKNSSSGSPARGIPADDLDRQSNIASGRKLDFEEDYRSEGNRDDEPSSPAFSQERGFAPESSRLPQTPGDDVLYGGNNSPLGMDNSADKKEVYSDDEYHSDRSSNLGIHSSREDAYNQNEVRQGDLAREDDYKAYNDDSGERRRDSYYSKGGGNETGDYLGGTREGYKNNGFGTSGRNSLDYEGDGYGESDYVGASPNRNRYSDGESDYVGASPNRNRYSGGRADLSGDRFKGLSDERTNYEGGAYGGNDFSGERPDSYVDNGYKDIDFNSRNNNDIDYDGDGYGGNSYANDHNRDDKYRQQEDFPGDSYTASGSRRAQTPDFDEIDRLASPGRDYDRKQPLVDLPASRVQDERRQSSEQFMPGNDRRFSTTSSNTNLDSAARSPFARNFPASDSASPLKGVYDDEQGQEPTNHDEVGGALKSSHLDNSFANSPTRLSRKTDETFSDNQGFGHLFSDSHESAVHSSRLDNEPSEPTQGVQRNLSGSSTTGKGRAGSLVDEIGSLKGDEESLMLSPGGRNGSQSEDEAIKNFIQDVPRGLIQKESSLTTSEKDGREIHSSSIEQAVRNFVQDVPRGADKPRLSQEILEEDLVAVNSPSASSLNQSLKGGPVPLRFQGKALARDDPDINDSDKLEASFDATDQRELSARDVGSVEDDLKWREGRSSKEMLGSAQVTKSGAGIAEGRLDLRSGGRQERAYSVDYDFEAGNSRNMLPQDKPDNASEGSEGDRSTSRSSGQRFDPEDSDQKSFGFLGLKSLGSKPGDPKKLDFWNKKTEHGSDPASLSGARFEAALPDDPKLLQPDQGQQPASLSRDSSWDELGQNPDKLGRLFETHGSMDTDLQRSPKQSAREVLHENRLSTNGRPASLTQQSNRLSRDSPQSTSPTVPGNKFLPKTAYDKRSPNDDDRQTFDDESMVNPETQRHPPGKNGKAGDAIKATLSDLESKDPSEDSRSILPREESFSDKKRKPHAGLDNLLAEFDGDQSNEQSGPQANVADSRPEKPQREKFDDLMTDLSSMSHDKDKQEGVLRSHEANVRSQLSPTRVATHGALQASEHKQLSPGFDPKAREMGWQPSPAHRGNFRGQSGPSDFNERSQSPQDSRPILQKPGSHPGETTSGGLLSRFQSGEKRDPASGLNEGTSPTGFDADGYSSASPRVSRPDNPHVAKDSQKNAFLPSISFKESKMDSHASGSPFHPDKDRMQGGFPLEASSELAKAEKSSDTNNLNILPNDNSTTASTSNQLTCGEKEVPGFLPSDDRPTRKHLEGSELDTHSTKDKPLLPPHPLRMGLPARPMPGRKSTLGGLDDKGPAFNDRFFAPNGNGADNENATGGEGKRPEALGRAPLPFFSTNEAKEVQSSPGTKTSGATSPNDQKNNFQFPDSQLRNQTEPAAEKLARNLSRGRLPPFSQNPLAVRAPLLPGDKELSPPTSRPDATETAKDVNSRPLPTGFSGVNSLSSAEQKAPFGKEPEGAHGAGSREIPRSESLNAKDSTLPFQNDGLKREPSQISQQATNSSAPVSTAGEMAPFPSGGTTQPRAMGEQHGLPTPISRGGLPTGPGLAAGPPKTLAPSAQSLPRLPGFQNSTFAPNTHQGPLVNQPKEALPSFSASDRSLPSGIQDRQFYKEASPENDQPPSSPPSSRMLGQVKFGAFDRPPFPGTEKGQSPALGIANQQLGGGPRNGTSSSTASGPGALASQGKPSAQGAKGDITTPQSLNRLPPLPFQNGPAIPSSQESLLHQGLQSGSKDVGKQSILPSSLQRGVPGALQSSIHKPPMPPMVQQGPQTGQRPANGVPSILQSRGPTGLPTSSAPQAPMLKQDGQNQPQNLGPHPPFPPKFRPGLPFLGAQRGTQQNSFPVVNRDGSPVPSTQTRSINPNQDGAQVPPSDIQQNAATSNVPVVPSPQTKSNAPNSTGLQSSAPPSSQRPGWLQPFSQKVPPIPPNPSTNMSNGASGPTLPGTTQNGQPIPALPKQLGTPAGLQPGLNTTKTDQNGHQPSGHNGQLPIMQKGSAPLNQNYNMPAPFNSLNQNASFKPGQPPALPVSSNQNKQMPSNIAANLDFLSSRSNGPSQPPNSSSQGSMPAPKMNSEGPKVPLPPLPPNTMPKGPSLPLNPIVKGLAPSADSLPRGPLPPSSTTVQGHQNPPVGASKGTMLPPNVGQKGQPLPLMTTNSGPSMHQSSKPSNSSTPFPGQAQKPPTVSTFQPGPPPTKTIPQGSNPSQPPLSKLSGLSGSSFGGAQKKNDHPIIPNGATLSAASDRMPLAPMPRGMPLAQPMAPNAPKIQGESFQSKHQEPSVHPNPGQTGSLAPPTQYKPGSLQNSQPLTAPKPPVPPSVPRNGMTTTGNPVKPPLPSTIQANYPPTTQKQPAVLPTMQNGPPFRIQEGLAPKAAGTNAPTLRGAQNQSTSSFPLSAIKNGPTASQPLPPNALPKGPQGSLTSGNSKGLSNFPPGFVGQSNPPANMSQSSAPPASQGNFGGAFGGAKALPPNFQTGTGGLFSASKPPLGTPPGKPPQSNMYNGGGLFGSSRPPPMMPPGTGPNGSRPSGPVPTNPPSNPPPSNNSKTGGTFGRSTPTPVPASSTVPLKKPSVGGGLFGSKPNPPIATNTDQNSGSKGSGGGTVNQAPAIRQASAPSKIQTGEGSFAASKQAPGPSNTPVAKPAPVIAQNNASQASSSSFFGRSAAPPTVHTQPSKSSPGGIFGSKPTGPPVVPIQPSKSSIVGVLGSKPTAPKVEQKNLNTGGSMGFAKPPTLPIPAKTSTPVPAKNIGMLGGWSKPPATTPVPANPIPKTGTPPPFRGQSSKPIPSVTKPPQTKAPLPPKLQAKESGGGFIGMFGSGGNDQKKPIAGPSQSTRNIPPPPQQKPQTSSGGGGGGIFGRVGSAPSAKPAVAAPLPAKNAAATNFSKPGYGRQGGDAVVKDTKAKPGKTAMPKVAAKGQTKGLGNLVTYVDGKRI